MKRKWKMDNSTRGFQFEYRFFDDIKIALVLPSSLEVDNWKISPKSSLKV